MTGLSATSAQQWCEAHMIPLSPEGIPDYSRRTDTERFDIPSDAGQRVALVRSNLEPFKNQSVLIWIREFGVWPSGQWEHLFNQFRRSYGIAEPLNRLPAQLIDPYDFDSVISISVYSVLMLWDCYIIPETTDRFLFYSHDEYGIKTKS